MDKGIKFVRDLELMKEGAENIIIIERRMYLIRFATRWDLDSFLKKIRGDRKWNS